MRVLLRIIEEPHSCSYLPAQLASLDSDHCVSSAMNVLEYGFRSFASSRPEVSVGPVDGPRNCVASFRNLKSTIFGCRCTRAGMRPAKEHVAGTKIRWIPSVTPATLHSLIHAHVRQHFTTEMILWDWGCMTKRQTPPLPSISSTILASKVHLAL